ncbi:MAG TPA: hypothetical protein VGR52_02975 [Stellaceae bacterium]|nr:hypothetical protein [Stellaceae bacterium]
MGRKIPGVYRVHDNMGVHHATTQELMRAGPRDPWAIGNLPSDAASKPTKENVQAFYKNAVRSGGSKAAALTKTKEYFDLADLKLDADGKVISFQVADQQAFPQGMTAAEVNAKNRRYWEPDKSGYASDQAPPTEAHGNVGNFAKSPDEPERLPLSDTPIRVGDHGVMSNALRRMNERMQRFYAGLGRPK